MGIIDQPCGECDICGHIWLLRENFTQNCEVCQRVACRKHLQTHQIGLSGVGSFALATIYVCSECLENSLPERIDGRPVMKTKFGESFEDPDILDARQKLRKVVIEKLSLKFKECIEEAWKAWKADDMTKAEGISMGVTPKAWKSSQVRAQTLPNPELVEPPKQSRGKKNE